MQEEQIVDLYWQRSEEAITETAIRYGSYCLTIAKNILWDVQDSEECVSDTYLKAWQAMPPHRPTRLSAFLGKITRRLAINRLESRQALKRGGGEFEQSLDELMPCIPDPNGLDSMLSARQLTDAINRFLDTQSAAARKIFVCRYFYCDTIESISRQFRWSESKVKSSLFRTRNHLRHFLEKEGIFL